MKRVLFVVALVAIVFGFSRTPIAACEKSCGHKAVCHKVFCHRHLHAVGQLCEKVRCEKVRCEKVRHHCCVCKRKCCEPKHCDLKCCKPKCCEPVKTPHLAPPLDQGPHMHRGRGPHDGPPLLANKLVKQ